VHQGEEEAMTQDEKGRGLGSGVKKVITRKRCEFCHVGEMRATGCIYSNSAGTYYDHKCAHCDHKQQFTKGYPHEEIVFEPSVIEEVIE
jgi:hypothetical protein